VEAAATAVDGFARFDPSADPSMAHLSEHGEKTVRTVRIDSLVASGEVRPPDVMKIDIEGAEVAALQGAAQAIDKHRPAILLATHGPDAHQGCLQFLRERGYHLASLTSQPIESTAELIARADVKVPATMG
jgi:hypothetical protein